MLTDRAVGGAVDGAEAIDGWALEGESGSLPDVADIKLERSEWLYLRPTKAIGGRSPRRLTRLSGMVCAMAGIALGVVTFSTGGTDPSYDLSAEIGSANVEDSTTDTSNAESAEEPSPVQTPTDPLLLALAQSLADDGELVSFNASPSDGTVSVDSGSATTTSGPGTTSSTTGLVEPEIEPESQWVDAGNGVTLPDVLLRIRFCESTNDYQAAHTVSSARGAYQFLTGSWGWYGHAQRYGVASADLATPAQQDDAALRTLQQDGTRPWLASRSCWASPGINPNYATTKPRGSTTTTVATTTTTASTGSSTSQPQATTTTTASTSTSSTASPTTTSSTTSTTSTTMPSSTSSTSTSTSTTSSTSTTING